MSNDHNNNNDYIDLKFEEIFDKYLTANSVKQITSYFQLLCKKLNINLNDYYEEKTQHHQPLYKLIQSRHQYWKAEELWKTFNKRASHRDYKRNLKNVSKDFKVLIIGCGPVGLRLSIECALLGIKCFIVEKRDRFSRNNVLHLWPYTIVDLKNLGAKKFYGQFCAGSIDHISIRKLQCVLLKVALLMGVEVHFNVSFENLIEPSENTSWKARFIPEGCKLSDNEYDVIVGADGRRNTLPGFRRKEFRGKLAIGITVNFLNTATQEEVEVQERSGVAFIFDQKFFLDLKKETGIDLENIVYYKDDTHYFVMTAKKQSLIDKGVILQDQSDANLLLSKDNVNFDKLCDYAKEAAYVSTDRKLTKLVFAKNHYGQADVAMFDFTSLFQAENASRITERHGKRLLTSLIGDSLLEPFWPTGTGIARGFLAVFDTAWQIRGFSMNKNPIDLLCERECIYQLLSQTTIDNLNKTLQDYSIDPATRYLNLTRNYTESQVRHLYDDGTTPVIDPIIQVDNQERLQYQTLLKWSQMVTQPYGLRIEDLTVSWKNGLAFCALIHRFRPDLINYEDLYTRDDLTRLSNVFKVLEKDLQTKVDALPEEIASCEIPNKFTIIMILDKIYGLFKRWPLTDVQLNLIDTAASISIQTNAHKQLKNRFNVNEDSSKKGKKIDIQKFTSIFKTKSTDQPKPIETQSISSNSKYSSYSTLCCICDQKVYVVERLNVEGSFVHPNCFRCAYCARSLRSALHASKKDPNTNKNVFYCTNHIDMANTAPRIENIVQRKRSFLTRNDEDSNRNDDSTTPVAKRINQEGEFLRRIGIKSRLFLNLKTPERAEFEFNPEINRSELNIRKQDTTSEDEDDNEIENENVSNTDDLIDQDCEDDEEDLEEVDDEELDEEEVEAEGVEEVDNEDEDDVCEENEENNEKPSELTKNKFGTLLKLATDYYSWQDNTQNDNKNETKIDEFLPPLPTSSPPTIKKPTVHLPSTVRIVTSPKQKQEHTIDKLTTCQKCFNIALRSSDRVIVSENVYHRECVKCYVCNTRVYSIENHILNDDEIRFYCERHWNDKLRVNQLLDEQGLSDDVSDEININDQYITKRKSDNRVNDEVKKFDSGISETSQIENKNEPNKLTLDVESIRQKALEKAKMKTDEQLGVPKTPTHLMNLITTSTHSSISSNSSNNTNQSQVVSNQTNTNEEFKERAEKIFEQVKQKAKQKILDDYKAPLAESETFDSIDDILPVRNNKKNSDNMINMLASTPIVASKSLNHQQPQFSDNSPTRSYKKSPNIKSKNYKFILNGQIKTHSEINNDENKPDAKKSTIKNGILKILHPRKSSSKSPTNTIDYNKTTHDCDDPNDNDNSFNTLNINRSPTLSRSTRKYKQSLKNMERQRKEKRLRMSQGILRELDVVLNSITELENDGVKIEQKICSMDDSQSEEKEKYEQCLYNLIHKKNLLTRVEDELNIQVKALIIEDQIAECNIKMNETRDLPDSEKSKEIIEHEANLLRQLVQLVEEKNRLVEQLEQLRIRERQEDSVVNSILSEKGYSLDPAEEIIMKHNLFKDII